MRSHISKILNLKVYKHNTYSIAFSEDEQKDEKKNKIMRGQDQRSARASKVFLQLCSYLFIFLNNQSLLFPQDE